VLRKQGVTYQEFYTKLFEYIKQDEWLNSEIHRIAEHYNNWADYGRIDHTPIQGMEIHGWNLVHSTIINLQSESKHKHIFGTIEKFLRQEFDIEESLLNDLMSFQRLFLIDFNNAKNYSMRLKVDNDILGYLQDNTELKNPAEYEFEFPENKEMSLQQFCEQIFFARRRNFGKAWITRL
jgi:hypothetical protein